MADPHGCLCLFYFKVFAVFFFFLIAFLLDIEKRGMRQCYFAMLNMSCLYSDNMVLWR